MAESDPQAIRASGADWTAQHLATYLESGGAQGHIVDLSDVGGRAFTTHCLIRYTGRKSGKHFITPLIYGNVGGEVVIVASKGGADSHPQWYLNLLPQETLDVQIATQAFEAAWREPTVTNGIRCWSTCATCFRPISPISSQRIGGSPSS